MSTFTLQFDSQKHTEFINITSVIQNEIAKKGWTEGILSLFVPHTTTGITINEGYDPDVVTDMIEVLDKIVPWKNNYRHSEGNTAAHVKASLMGSSLFLCVEKGKLQLGTWQAIFYCEFDGPRNQRKLRGSFISKA